MSKGIIRRTAALCSVVIVSGFAGLGSAQAAPPAPVVPKAAVRVRVAPVDGPVVKLGRAVLEEYTVTPGGIAVIEETVRGTSQDAQASAAKAADQPSGHKA